VLLVINANNQDAAPIGAQKQKKQNQNYFNLEIQGHSDNTGNKDLNLKLSQQRADNIIKYLVENGINASQLIAKGYGDSMPVASNTTAEGKSKNRRVEMKVIE
jgi:outer membrane protein OmpA-like peptidoglycan-associated protein